MRPANHAEMDYRKVVQEGYDRCAAGYEAQRRGKVHPELELLTRRLAPGASVLDVGCGAGVPIAAALAQRYRVTGVDLSAEQVKRARANVPRATFLQADILEAVLPDGSFDGVVAFYSIFHLPREQHAALFRRVHGWLKPDGYLLATVTRERESAYTEDDFFGVTMYWSNFGLSDYEAMLPQLGFRLLECTVIGHGYVHAAAVEEHPLIFAQKLG